MAPTFKKQPKAASEQRVERRAKPRNTGGAPKQAKSSASSKGKRFILLLGDEGGILVYMQGNKVVRRLFAPSAQPAHTEAMHEIMTAHPKVPVYILADVLDQQYVAQTFPPVSSLSVGGLVKRRLDRDFQTEDMKGALPLGRDKGGRKEWKFLLVSLAKTPLMTEWLDLIVELPNELKGLYLVPIEAVNYVSMLNKKLGDSRKPWQLFISHNKVSGFRQVVIHEGKLVFTRVSQAIDEAIPAVIAGNIEQEIINTIEYLKRLGFSDNSGLDATVVVSQDVIDSLDLGRFNFANTQIISPVRVADMLGLEQAALSADRFGDVVMAAAFGIAKKRELRFTTAYIEKLAKLYKAQIGIKAGQWLLVLLFVGLTAMSVLDIAENSAGVTAAKEEATKLQPGLESLKKQVDGLGQDVSFKSAVVATYDAYIKDTPTPDGMLINMMPLITPQHRMSSIDWAYTEPNPKASAGSGSPPLPVDAKVEFDFSGTVGGAETLTKTAGELVDAMKTALPQYEVSSEKYPWDNDKHEEATTLDIGQGSSLSVQEMTAAFKLKGPKKGTGAGAAPVNPGGPAGVPGMPGGPGGAGQ